MSNNIKYITYSKILILSFDIENLFGPNWCIEKILFSFNKSTIEGNRVKPCLIKFKINEVEGGSIIKSEEYEWTIENIYNELNFIPLYIIPRYPSSNYGAFDINDNLYSITNKASIEKLKNYEDDAYKFEITNGMISINEELVEQLLKILNENEIGYEVEKPDGENYKSIIIYSIYQDCEPMYKITVSLDGRVRNNLGYCITPELIKFSNYQSIGKFKVFNNHTVNMPNDEHLALITKCPCCEANIICDWLNFKGTECPYCAEKIVL